MAMELERQMEVARRIKELRGPRPQEALANEIPVTLRAYQEWEAGGGIAWANLQRLAEIHGVSTNWLLYGDERPEGARSQLDRIEAGVKELLARSDRAGAEAEAETRARQSEGTGPASVGRKPRPRRRGRQSP
jgi:hypothetical protein